MKKISVLLILCCLLMFLSFAVAYSRDRKGSAAEGRVVGKDGSPLPGVTAVAILPSGEYKDGYEEIKAVADATGKFKLKGLYPGTYYRIFFRSGQCNDPRERIRNLPPGETLSLGNEYTLLFSPFKVLSNGVIEDPRTGLEWAPVPMPTVNYEMALAYARSLGLAGGGWRLPTIDELEGLYETGQGGCGLDSAFGDRYPNAWAANVKHQPDLQVFDFLQGRVDTRPGDDVAPCDNCRVLPVRSPMH